MRLPGACVRRVEAEFRPWHRPATSLDLPALPENATRELPRPPQDVAHLIRELARKSGTLTPRISKPSIDRKQVRELAGLSFVERAENVVLLGPPDPAT
jgi:IstB-like ATP binding protein